MMMMILKAYASCKGAGLLETSGMMAEPRLVDSPLLYTDYTTLSEQQILAAETWLWLPILSACLIWLVPCDFFLFPRLKLQLWGCLFQPVPEIQKQLLTIQHTILKQSVPVVLPEMADVLDTLNKLRRKLLWRRRQWSKTYINVHGSPHRSWQLFFFARMWQCRKLHIHVWLPMADTYRCQMVIYIQEPLVGGKTTTCLFYSCPHCCIVAYRANMEQRIQHTGFKKNFNDLQCTWQVCLWLASSNREGAKHHKHY